jgi:hypothetical protein
MRDVCYQCCATMTDADDCYQKARDGIDHVSAALVVVTMVTTGRDRE